MANRKAVIAVALFALTVGVAAAPAPKAGIATLAALPVVIKNPYDETANANAAVDAAFARARISGKRVLIDLGGNWCPDCIVLANVMRLPDVEPFIAAHYEVSVVDVGRFNKNLQIPARFGITEHLVGVPSVLIVDPDGELVDGGHIAALEDARSMAPQAIVDWLASWTK
jgi:hypothetical protein